MAGDAAEVNASDELAACNASISSAAHADNDHSISNQFNQSVSSIAGNVRNQQPNNQSRSSQKLLVYREAMN